MTSYTITITPEDAEGATTILRLDMTRGVATLTDMHLHGRAGLSAGQLPAIDYALLLRAVGQETTAPAKAAAAGKAAGRGVQPARRARRAAPTAAQPVKTTRARVAVKKAAQKRGGEGRAYRRMPEDLAAVYSRIGGATAVAEHYGVPRHTVQGWLRRLRAEGIIPAG
jgi:Homeodomain-like domain